MQEIEGRPKKMRRKEGWEIPNNPTKITEKRKKCIALNANKQGTIRATVLKMTILKHNQIKSKQNNLNQTM